MTFRSISASVLAGAGLVITAAMPALAQAAAPVPDKGDTAWMLTSTALVLMMTAPGLAMFYGGLVRRKNVLSVIMQCFFLMGLMTVIWALYGYSLSFGGDKPWIGNADPLAVAGDEPDRHAEREPDPVRDPRHAVIVRRRPRPRGRGRRPWVAGVSATG